MNVFALMQRVICGRLNNMPTLIVLVSLVPILLFGELARSIIAPTEGFRGERVALALALGCGAMALLLFYFSLLHVPSALYLTLGAVLLLVTLAYGKKILRDWRCVPRCDRRGVGVLTPFIILAGVVTLAALNTDLGFDGWSHWGFKARVAFIEGGWANTYFAHPWPQFIHRDYPLLLPSLEAWAFAFLGQLDEQALKIIFPFFYLGVLLLFYGAAREVRSTLVSLLFVGLLGATPYFASIAAPSGYADVPLMLYIFGAVVFLRRWFQHDKDSDLWMGALLAALGVWVKREGMVYWLVNLTAIAVWLGLARAAPWRVRARALVIFLLPAVVIIVPWFAFLASFQMPPSDFAFTFDATRWSRLPVIAVNVVGQFTTVTLWGGLWFIFFLLSLTRLRGSPFADSYVWVCAVLPFLLLQLSFLFSILDPFTEHLQLASDRLCMHEIAMAWFWIALQAGGLERWLAGIWASRETRIVT